MTPAAPVGGRLEADPPRPVTNTGDRWRLVALLVVAAAVHAAVVSRTAMTARDGIGFARTARQLAHPAALDPKFTPFDVLRNTQHPPGYPAALLAVSQFAPGSTDQDRLLYAGQLVSGIAGTLLVLPLYWLGRTLFGQPAGFGGALLFTFLPVAARYTSDAVTEGLYLLGLCTALLLGTRAVRKPTVGGFLLTGLAGGCAYLVRPEGTLALLAVGVVTAGLALARRESAGATLGRLTALGVGFLLVTVWYMLVIGGLTNKPTAQGFLPAMNLRQAATEGAAAPAGPALFASWQAGDLPGVARELFKEGTKAFHYGPPAFALVGLFLAARRLRAEPYLLVPLAFAGLMLPVLAALGLKEGYVSERHTLAVVMVLCPFAVAGLLALGGVVGRLGLVVILATCVPGLAKPLHKDRLGHRLAGEYLARHADPADVLIDPWDWAAFYSGRTLTVIPPDPPATAGRSRWAVIEPKEKGLSNLPRFQAAVNVMSDGANRPTVAFSWPEGVPPEEAKVVLYRQVIK